MLIFGKLCSPPVRMLEAVSLTDQEIPEVQQQTKDQSKDQKQIDSVEGTESDGREVCLTSNRLPTPADLLNIVVVVVVIHQDSAHCKLGFFQLNKQANTWKHMAQIKFNQSINQSIKIINAKHKVGNVLTAFLLHEQDKVTFKKQNKNKTGINIDHVTFANVTLCMSNN